MNPPIGLKSVGHLECVYSQAEEEEERERERRAAAEAAAAANRFIVHVFR